MKDRQNKVQTKKKQPNNDIQNTRRKDAQHEPHLKVRTYCTVIDCCLTYDNYYFSHIYDDSLFTFNTPYMNKF